MNNEIKITTEDFLKAGFIKDNDPQFYFRFDLISDESRKDIEDETDIPALLFGDTGINQGYCIFTGSHFVWFNAESPQEAIEFSKKITAFEEV
ncbi:hypothetical protein [Sphingobacterium multivorum]|uniref:hypothetical protein n=1 Tax=Sphingobacterium multivorum TaxID=28454 RepID=UPI003DA311DB